VTGRERAEKPFTETSSPAFPEESTELGVLVQ
jgi:hypothetical protein